jgi:hypothetical protein
MSFPVWPINIFHAFAVHDSKKSAALTGQAVPVISKAR